MPSVTRRALGQRESRRDALRSRLLDVVERLLGEGESFTELSVERLVAEAGIARSTFYVYFEDKGDLLRAWFAEITEELRDSAAAWWSIDRAPSLDDVRGVLGGIVATYRPHTTLMAAVYDAAAYDSGVRDPVQAMMDENVAGLRRHIRVGQRDGFIDPSLPGPQTAAWLTWMAERGLHRLVRTATDAEVERLVDAYAQIVWKTLYTPAALRR